jgi:hypothetical protein
MKPTAELLSFSHGFGLQAKFRANKRKQMKANDSEFGVT